MTLWDGRSVLRFAMDAGFHPATLEEAVAVALAGSQGEDSTVTGASVPGGRRWVGLWQIPLGPNSDPSDALLLTDPLVNAQVAHRMWTTLQGFSWVPSRTAPVLALAAAKAHYAAQQGPGDTMLGSGAQAPLGSPPGDVASDIAGRATATVDGTARLAGRYQ